MNSQYIELKRLNFNDLLKIEDYRDTYSIANCSKSSDDKSGKGKYKHNTICGCCNACKDIDIYNKEYFKNKKYTPEEFELSNVSHGAHTNEFIAALEDNKVCYPKIDDGSDEGVLFVFENPSAGSFYNQSVKGKKIADEWYWTHDINSSTMCGYPNSFGSKKYDELLASIIVTFKLKNAYVTNMVKCGMIPKQETEIKKPKFLNTSAYSDECINKCYTKYLKREIEILKPKVIFAVGAHVYNNLKCRTDIIKDCELVSLPHPAIHGLKDEYFRTLYFCGIARALIHQKIIDKEVAYKFFNEEKLEDKK